MATAHKADPQQWFADKRAMQHLAEEIDARAGIVFDPTVTPQKLRKMLAAQGIRPEDNMLSRDIIRAKYPGAGGDEA